MTHPHPKRSFVPQAVLTRSGKVNTAGASVNTVIKQVNTAASTPIVKHPRPKSNAFKRGNSQSSRPFNRYYANNNNIFNKKVNIVMVNDTTARERAVGNPQQKEYKEKAVIDSGCSRHMTGNKCYLTKYEDYDGGFVSFGDELKLLRKRGRDTKIPQSGGPPKNVGDEAIHKELGDRMERAATTASSLEAKQDSDAQTRFEIASIMSNDPPLSRGNTLRSGEDSMKLNELTVLYTTFSKKVKSLESDLKQTKLTYSAAYTKLIKRVKKLEHKIKSSKVRRKVRLVVLEDESDLEDPSKHGRKIIQSDEELALRLHAEEQAEFERLQKERVAQEEASKAAIDEEL
ncbi:hypothetical protein Tco_0860119 [Tanacetum coccineum]|uniref:Retrovirus-related Pol polyprotein from transposon TNT 1-94-like beta-barrel domain-containing protein n=1 Tax=Tanacetum coccineum TaxID=301880 RepID=A0ABQ5BH53_9ASTR